jgi:hypothetical protein
MPALDKLPVYDSLTVDYPNEIGLSNIRTKSLNPG